MERSKYEVKYFDSLDYDVSYWERFYSDIEELINKQNKDGYDLFAQSQSSPKENQVIVVLTFKKKAPAQPYPVISGENPRYKRK